MNTPANPQACHIMGVYLQALYDTLLISGDEVPNLRKLSISKLAMMMREEIRAAQAESPLTRAQQDASFQAIKAKLLKKPHKNSRLWKEGA